MFRRTTPYSLLAIRATRSLCLVLFMCHTGAFAAVSISDFQPVQVSEPQVRQPQQQIQLAFGDTQYQLNLQPNTALLADLPAAQLQAINASGQRFYTGSVAGQPHSWVRLSWVNQQWSGGFFDGRQVWVIDVAATLQDALPRSPTSGTELVIYRLSDVSLDAPADNRGVVPAGASRQRLTGEQILAALEQLSQGGQLESLPITIVTDTQYNSVHGGNVPAVVLSRLNFVDGLYTGQVGVGLFLDHLEQLTSNGTLTSTNPSTLLVDQFRPFMTTGAGSSIPNNGVAHLFTGRNIDGSTVGIAYVGVLCSSGFGYGVDQNVSSATTSALIFAHELGHNFDAPHDGEDECVNETFNGIMNPSINGSQVFSDCSLEQMAPEVAAANCLVSQTESFFEDGFEQ